MRIAVIAASGRTGQVFVKAALASGHNVRAGVRGTNPFHSHPHLSVITCDATNEQDLRRLIRGQDAVVSLIGHVKNSPPNVQTAATKGTISVMNELGIRRLVSLTGTGVRFPNDKITLIDQLFNIAIRLIDPARVKDGKTHVAELQRSNLEWTVLRVLKLQNVPPGTFTLTLHGPTKPFVNRDDVAKAILQLLEDTRFIRQAPIIS